tara:strand:- start:1420 stop:2022 length:603 start_codon:yes stop_codon:yes gene_type:complete
MKIFLAILILVFGLHSWSKADNIREFEIEGMSVGNSLLDFFSKQEIKKKMNLDFYKNFPEDYRETYGIITFNKIPRFKTYTNVSMDFFVKDNEFIIQTINGVIFIDNSEECYKKQNLIDKDLSKLFENTTRQTNKANHSYDKTGNSKTRAINYWFDNDDLITLICTDWSEELTEKHGWSDSLSLEIKTKEYNDFLKEAYN